LFYEKARSKRLERNELAKTLPYNTKMGFQEQQLKRGGY
jgi:hypothetical protein